MNTYADAFAFELSNALAATGENYMTEIVNLDAYGTSYSITKHGSDRKLYITQVEKELIDLALYDETGNIIATGTLFPKTAKEITSENLAKLVSLCFQGE